MGRPVALFTGQLADLPIEPLFRRTANWGYDGLELVCWGWGDHFDEEKVFSVPNYCDRRRRILDTFGPMVLLSVIILSDSSSVTRILTGVRTRLLRQNLRVNRKQKEDGASADGRHR